ncbi:MAG: hypothetical protein ABFD97_08710 [Syntrophobacter sp.]
MKVLKIISLAFALVLSWDFCAYGQAWVLYDNFDKTNIDRAKWSGDEYPGTGMLFYENTRRIEADPTLGNRLHLAIRNYGPISDLAGAVWSQNRFNFCNPETIKGIKATIWANSLKATGCSANNGTSSAYARILGYFFNTTGNTVEGSYDGNVSAQIRLFRMSNSKDPAGVLRVNSVVLLCLDDACDNSSVIASSDMGRISSGQAVTLSILWDQENKRFIAKKDSNAPVYLSYDGKVPTDQYAPVVDEKRLTASCVPSRCPAGAAIPYAVADVYIDNVYVKYLDK